MLDGKRGLVFAVVFALGMGFLLYLGPYRTSRDQKHIRALLGRMRTADVTYLIVYNGHQALGSHRTINDPATIQALVQSVKKGVSHSPNHDAAGRFERYVILEPQHIAFRAYELASSNALIVVVEELSTRGRVLRSAYFKVPWEAWKDL